MQEQGNVEKPWTPVVPRIPAGDPSKGGVDITKMSIEEFGAKRDGLLRDIENLYNQ